MTLTLSPQTETLLQEQAGLLGQEATELADALLLDALEAARQDYEETCQAIAEGLAQVETGQTVSFEEAWAGREARRAARRFPVRDAA
jgi:predicted transcriptional regulator